MYWFAEFVMLRTWFSVREFDDDDCVVTAISSEDEIAAGCCQYQNDEVSTVLPLVMSTLKTFTGFPFSVISDYMRKMGIKTKNKICMPILSNKYALKS